MYRNREEDAGRGYRPEVTYYLYEVIYMKLRLRQIALSRSGASVFLHFP